MGAAMTVAVHSFIPAVQVNNNMEAIERGYSYVLFRGDKRRTVLEEDMYVEKIAMIFQVL